MTTQASLPSASSWRTPLLVILAGCLIAMTGFGVRSIVIIAATWAFGREHPAVYRSQSVAVFEDMRAMVENGEVPGLPSISGGPPSGDERPVREARQRRDEWYRQEAGN